MKTFENLEKEYERTHVTLISTSNTASGIFSLARGNTELLLSSAKEMHHDRDDSGWYDLLVREDDGKVILLKNALTIGGTWFSGGAVQEKIFPNVVVFDAQNLSKNSLVRSVSFSISSMRHFFHYQSIEWVGLHRAREEDLMALKKLSRRDRYKKDVFDPRDVYMVHRFPKNLIRFKLGGHTFTVSHRYEKFGPSWGGIKAKVYPVACIDFGGPLSISDAIDCVWSWKRFFRQISMQPLSVEGIEVRSFGRPIHKRSSVYLPNVSSEKVSVHPGDIPLNEWKNRRLLAEVMCTWMSKDIERRQFRVSIDRVIDRSRKRVSLDDIVTMCAAIESLPDFVEPSSVTHSQIDALADAARIVAEKQKICVDVSRIKGVLDLLMYQSLPRRLTLLGRALSGVISKKDAELVMGVVRDLRNIAAHGQAVPEITMPKVAPAVQALLSICVLYDLTTCSVPSLAREHTFIIALQKANEAIQELRRLHGK